MASRSIVPSLTAVVLTAGLAGTAIGDDRIDELPEAHRGWLTKEVVYIVTEREKEVFLSLDTMEERDRFIEAFWKRRDPNPATSVNEYKDELYERIAYANEHLGRETYLEGWQTDRGRFHIILGEPREVQRFDGYEDLVSIELWFYQSDPELGLPAFFYLLFFKQANIGGYKLYSPISDTPAALFAGGRFPIGSDNLDVIEALTPISPELAAASLSFDTSEPPDYLTGQPTLGTTMLVNRIEESPKRRVRVDYAENWLRDRGRVSADYSFNFVPSRSAFAVLADPSGTALVHYSVEIDPQNFSLETDEEKSKFYTTLDLTIEARTIEGRLVVASDSEAYVELTPSQMQMIGANPFSYQNDFPLLPGDYTVSVILRNRVVRQYTVAEREIHVPDFRSGSPILADVITAFETQIVPGEHEPGAIRTYQIGNLQIRPATDNLLVLGETLHAITQVVGPAPGHALAFELWSDETRLHTVESEIGSNGVAVAQISLADLVGGNYEVAARLTSPDGKTVAETRRPLVLSPRSTTRRPIFVLRRGVDTRIPGLLSLMIGDQYWNLGLMDEAENAYEDAVAANNPRLVQARWKLASTHLRREEPERALELLLPLEEQFPEQYEVVSGIGLAAWLEEDYAAAVDYLERAQKLRPPETVVLNALGRSHQLLGNLESARAAFERSLAVDPDQPAIEDLLKQTRP